MSTALEHMDCLDKELWDMQLEVVRRTGEEIARRVDAVDCRGALEAVRSARQHVGAMFVPRLKELQAKKRMLIVEVLYREQKMAMVERALEAGMRLDAVVAAATAAQEDLQRSKLELTKATAEENAAKWDLEEGVGSDEAVAKGARKVAEASKAVEVARSHYEEAMRELVAVRQGGLSRAVVSGSGA
jgi:hypothetical protein